MKHPQLKASHSTDELFSRPSYKVSDKLQWEKLDLLNDHLACPAALDGAECWPITKCVECSLLAMEMCMLSMKQFGSKWPLCQCQRNYERKAYSDTTKLYKQHCTPPKQDGKINVVVKNAQLDPDAEFNHARWHLLALDLWEKQEEEEENGKFTIDEGTA
ncbi:hypothetical protein L345_11558, partial [Ophiophagus hannah]